MIKKSVFENELITGMHQQLYKLAVGETPDLVRAGECLHAALEILEAAGLQKRADQVLDILAKIAVDNPTKHVQHMPSMQDLEEYGLTRKDVQDFGAGQQGAKIKMNAVLRNMGWNEHQIGQFIGKHNIVSEQDIKAYEHILKMIQTPSVPLAAEQVSDVPEDPSVPSELSFKSMANKPRKPGRPDKADRHTNKLTSDKMIANLKDHGTVFNMANDGIDISNADFDPEIAEALGSNNADDMSADDLLDADIVDDILEVADLEPLEDFEDEVHSADDKVEHKPGDC